MTHELSLEVKHTEPALLCVWLPAAEQPSDAGDLHSRW